MNIILWDLLWIIVGVPCSYQLSKRYITARHEFEGNQSLTKKKLLQLSLIIWIDGLVLIIVAEAIRRYLWIPFSLWIILNYSMLAIILMRRKRKSQMSQ